MKKCILFLCFVLGIQFNGCLCALDLKHPIKLGGKDGENPVYTCEDADKHCIKNEICVKMLCLTPCHTDKDCEEKGLPCRKLDEKLVCHYCWEDSMCKQDERCYKSVCRKLCNSIVRCKDSMQCIEHHCIPKKD